MKRSFWGISLIAFFVLAPSLVFAGCNFGLSGGGTYSWASWHMGSEYDQPNTPIEEHQRSSFSWRVSGYIKTDVLRLPWGLEIMLRIDYGEFRYDFSDSKHPILNINPRIVSGLIGVNKEFGKWNVCGLVGASYMFDMRGDMVAIGDDGYPIRHSENPDSTRPVLSFGVNYLFNLKSMRLGPEFNLNIYPIEMGFDLCREFGAGMIHPYLGLIVWW
jgi:hypothetical protein